MTEQVLYCGTCEMLKIDLDGDYEERDNGIYIFCPVCKVETEYFPLLFMIPKRKD